MKSRVSHDGRRRGRFGSHALAAALGGAVVLLFSSIMRPLQQGCDAVGHRSLLQFGGSLREQGALQDVPKVWDDDDNPMCFVSNPAMLAIPGLEECTDVRVTCEDDDREEITARDGVFKYKLGNKHHGTLESFSVPGLPWDEREVVLSMNCNKIAAVVDYCMNHMIGFGGLNRQKYGDCFRKYGNQLQLIAEWYMGVVARVVTPDVESFGAFDYDRYTAALALYQLLQQTGDGIPPMMKGSMNWEMKEGVRDRLHVCSAQVRAKALEEDCHPTRFLTYVILKMKSGASDDNSEESNSEGWGVPFSHFYEDMQVARLFSTPIAKTPVPEKLLSKAEQSFLADKALACYNAFAGASACLASLDPLCEVNSKNGEDVKSKFYDESGSDTETNHAFFAYQNRAKNGCQTRTQKEIPKSMSGHQSMPCFEACYDLFQSEAYKKYDVAVKNVARGYGAKLGLIRGDGMDGGPDSWADTDTKCFTWIAVYKDDTTHEWHEHTTHTVSGVFYMQASEGSKIFFHDPRGSKPWLSERPDLQPIPIDPYAFEPREVTVESGTVLIFPSNAYHMVPSRSSGVQVAGEGEGEGRVNDDDGHEYRVGKSSARACACVCVQCPIHSYSTDISVYICALASQYRAESPHRSATHTSHVSLHLHLFLLACTDADR